MCVKHLWEIETQYILVIHVKVLAVGESSQKLLASKYQTRIFFTIYTSVKRMFFTDSYESAADIRDMTSLKQTRSSVKEGGLSHTIIVHSGHIMIRFQILKQTIVNVAQVITVCSVVLVQKVKKPCSWWVIVDFRLDCSAEIRGGCVRLTSSPLPIMNPCNQSQILTGLSLTLSIKI